MSIDWRKALHKSWQDILKKAKSSNEGHINKSIIDFASNADKRIEAMERCLKKETYYHFGKWKAVLQDKKDGEKRPILIPYIGDRIVLKAVAEYISTQLKTEFDSVAECSFAYQKGKSVRDALLELKSRYSRGKIILKIDIQKFFNNIDRDVVCELLEKILHDSYLIGLVKKSLDPAIDFTNIGSASITDFDRNGLPQGNPVSAVLSNLYLYDFDIKMRKENHKMIRYADDMIFLVDNKDEAVALAENIAEYLESTRRLNIHPLSSSIEAKSAIFENLRNRQFKFLGVIFDGEKLLPAQDCIGRLMSKIKSICRDSIPADKKIRHIKRSVSQWCGYYAFTDISDGTLKSMSSKIKKEAQAKGIDLPDVDLIKKMHHIRRKQQNKGRYIFVPAPKFGDDYLWLQVY